MSYLDRLFCLSSKVVVVTGALGQLGLAIGEAYRQAGALVVGWDIPESASAAFQGEVYYSVDIRDQQAVNSSFCDIVTKYGRIDVLINNAGVSTFENFEERPEAQFDWVMDVNLKGTFFCTQAFINCFDRRDSALWSTGAIVNIGSIFGVVSPDFRNYTDTPRKNSEVYGATKAGVIQMTKYFAVHLAERGIRVNAVSPGGIFNPAQPQGEDFRKNYGFRTPMGRMANDAEMVGAVLYLSSDAASYTTGQNIVIDGGLTAW